jgi:flagellar biosynthetic protein FlhB
MPENSAQDKSEEPTAHRLRKARQEGQVPQSQEVPSALTTGILLLMLAIMASSFIRWARDTVVSSIAVIGQGPADGAIIAESFRVHTLAMYKIAAPFLIAFLIAGIGGSVAVGGLNFSTKALKIKWDAISPVKGIKNMVSLQSLVKLGMSIVKMILMGMICYFYLRAHSEDILLLRWDSPGEICANIGWLVFGLLLRVVIFLLIIAGLDFVYQRWQYKRKLRMSKQEIKEEHKQYQGSPEVRGRIRQLQMEMASRRMLQDVPQADVVITNPTHFAIALKYDINAMDAPLVLAKGQDELALKIREIAQAHKVPIVERPQLARALYAQVEVGQPVPEELFVAVAEVLAMIYRMRRKRRTAQR